MAQQVIKRDGTKEPFDEEKVKKAIQTAAGEAGLAPERAEEVVNQVSSVVLDFAAEKEEIASSELGEKVLSELDKVEPSAAEAWRKYDQARGR
jgi:transcriptional repressor NrdR